MRDIEDGIIVNLLTSLIVSLLVSIEQQIPDHSVKARKLKKVEEALREFATLNSDSIPETLIGSGVDIWNTCIERLQHVLENYVEDVEHEEHPELFHYDCNGVISYTSYHYINQ
jgi:hypothetical protein